MGRTDTMGLTGHWPETMGLVQSLAQDDGSQGKGRKPHL
jgi:hypothetical protein